MPKVKKAKAAKVAPRAKQSRTQKAAPKKQRDQGLVLTQNFQESLKALTQFLPKHAKDLKKEVEQVTRERDILKKALAIFSSAERKNMSL